MTAFMIQVRDLDAARQRPNEPHHRDIPNALWSGVSRATRVRCCSRISPSPELRQLP